MLLFTVGDSFTYGEELTHRDKDAWPVLVAKHLGYKLVNQGSPGTSCDYAVKQTVKAVSRMRPDLVIVAWSSAGRMEFADDGGAFDIWPGSNLEIWNHRHQGHRKELVKYITRYNNTNWEYRRWLRNCVLLQSFLKQENVAYRFVNTFDNLVYGNKYIEDSVEYTSLLDTKNFIGWPDKGFIDWIEGSPKGPNGHPLELGHKRIAEKIIDNLNMEE